LPEAPRGQGGSGFLRGATQAQDGPDSYLAPSNSSSSNVDNGSGSDDDLLVLEVFYSLSWTYKLPFVKPDSADQNPQVHENVTPISAEVGPEWERRVQAQTSRVRKEPEPATDAGPSAAPPCKRLKKAALGPHGRKPENRIPTSSG
jgi:hypothetical protein